MLLLVLCFGTISSVPASLFLSKNIPDNTRTTDMISVYVTTSARIPCDSTGTPLVIPVAGHVDELPDRTWLDQAQLNLIEHVSTKGKTCVYHSHVPAVDLTQIGNPGAPRITDIGLLNLSDKNVVFRTGNAMSFTVLNVVGNINPPNNYGPGGNMPLPYSCADNNKDGACDTPAHDIYPKFPSGTISFDNGTHAGH